MPCGLFEERKHGEFRVFACTCCALTPQITCERANQMRARLRKSPVSSVGVGRFCAQVPALPGGGASELKDSSTIFQFPSPAFRHTYMYLPRSAIGFPF